MKQISIFIVALLVAHSFIYGEVFDTKVVPLSIRLGTVHGIQAQNLNQVSYPKITYADLDKGLYIVPNAIETTFSTSKAWSLYLLMSEQYHDDPEVGIYPQHRVLWRFSKSQDSFKELKGGVENLIRSGSSPTSGESVLLDIAFDISWGTPSNFQYSFPFTFSVMEDHK